MVSSEASPRHHGSADAPSKRALDIVCAKIAGHGASVCYIRKEQSLWRGANLPSRTDAPLSTRPAAKRVYQLPGITSHIVLIRETFPKHIEHYMFIDYIEPNRPDGEKEGRGQQRRRPHLRNSQDASGACTYVLRRDIEARQFFSNFRLCLNLFELSGLQPLAVLLLLLEFINGLELRILLANSSTRRSQQCVPSYSGS